MNYNKGNGILDFISDQNNKSKVMLIGYVVLFILLVVFVRLGGTNNTAKNEASNTSTNTTTQLIETVDDDDTSLTEMVHTEDDEKNDNSVYNRFSFLRTNNYSLVFNIDVGKKITIEGDRYNSKYKLKMTNEENDSVLDCLANGDTFKVLTNGEYEIADYPIIFIDYFNNNVLYNIVNNSKVVSDKDGKIVLSISNNELNKYVNKSFSTLVDSNKQADNEITISLNNNKVSEITLDLSNILKDNSEYKMLKISLKYDKFTQIQDFDVDF